VVFGKFYSKNKRIIEQREREFGEGKGGGGVWAILLHI